MSTPEQEPPLTYPAQAVADMRGTARWFIAACAAVGGLLLGGVPLTAIGNVTGAGDIALAVGGLALAMQGARRHRPPLPDGQRGPRLRRDVPASGADTVREGNERLILDALDEEMRETSDGRRIGMVITFGRSSTGEFAVARHLAQDVNAMLLDERPGAFCSSNVGTRDFWYEGAADAVDIEIYYVNSCTVGATE